MRLVPSFLVSLSLSCVAVALPLDGAQQPRQRIAPRAKSYSIVNVDGGATTTPPPETVVETVTRPGPEAPTKTETIRITDIVAPLPAETSSSSSSLPPSTTQRRSSSSNTVHSSSQPAESASMPTSTTPAPATKLPVAPAASKPEVATTIRTLVVTVSQPAPTEFYDDGMWRTRYPVKTFDPVVVNATSSSSSVEVAIASVPTTSTLSLPTLPPHTTHWYNGTQLYAHRRKV